MFTLFADIVSLAAVGCVLLTGTWWVRHTVRGR